MLALRRHEKRPRTLEREPAINTSIQMYGIEACDNLRLNLAFSGQS